MTSVPINEPARYSVLMNLLDWLNRSAVLVVMNLVSVLVITTANCASFLTTGSLPMSNVIMTSFILANAAWTASAFK